MDNTDVVQCHKGVSMTNPIPPTEQRLDRSMDLDQLDTLALVDLINSEDARVPGAVRAVLPELAGLVDRTVTALAAGGRVHYFGSGTSGRFGVLDAAEVPPTYGVPPTLFVAHLSGGAEAMVAAIEEAEDSEEDGAAAAQAVTSADIAIGLSASGRTPYAGAALRTARAAGAYTVAITSNPHATIAAHADLHLYLATGPEVVTGSTRMKAGGAEKLVLTTFSTAVMVRMGRTYSNLMIDVAPINAKLRRRVIRLLTSATGVEEPAAVAALKATGGHTKQALVMLLTGVGADTARVALETSGGNARVAVASLVTRA
jgi:N-acetylmuramic acid 6-phosphate etherase